MNFYAVISKRRKTDESERHFAERLGVPWMTLRGWRISDPKALTIYHIAKNLGEDPGPLLTEWAEDQKGGE